MLSALARDTHRLTPHTDTHTDTTHTQTPHTDTHRHHIHKDTTHRDDDLHSKNQIKPHKSIYIGTLFNVDKSKQSANFWHALQQTDRPRTTSEYLG